MGDCWVEQALTIPSMMPIRGACRPGSILISVVLPSLVVLGGFEVCIKSAHTVDGSFVPGVIPPGKPSQAKQGAKAEHRRPATVVQLLSEQVQCDVRILDFWCVFEAVE